MHIDDVVRDFQLVPPVDPSLAERRDLADRLSSLAGARLGLLDNRKGNADLLLKLTGEELRCHHGVTDLEMLVKPIFSRPAPPDIIEALRDYDAVLTAIGD
jgi:hypothetical protein